MAEESLQNETSSEYDALIARGISSLEMDDLDGVASVCSDAARTAPDRPEAYFLLGIIAHLLDDQGSAIEMLTKAHEINPDVREFAQLLGNVHTRVGNLNDGIFFAKLAEAGDPHPQFSLLDLPDLMDLGRALENAEVKSYVEDARIALSEGRFSDVISLCQRELRLRQGSPTLYLTLGEALFGERRFAQAIDAIRASIHLDSSSARSFLKLGEALLALGEFERAVACLQRASELADDDSSINNAVAALAARAAPLSSTASKLFEERQVTQKHSVSASRRTDYLRVAVLTDCARQVDEMRIVESYLNGIDRTRNFIHVYSIDQQNDPMPSRMRGLSSGWTNIRNHSEDGIAARINSAGHDVLIDLCSSAEGQLPSVVAASPCALQVGLFGPKPGLLGAGYDRVMVHPKSSIGEDRELLSELPLVAIAPETLPDVSGEGPAESREYVTFASTLDLSQLTPSVAATYAAILREVPGSRLLLGNRNHFDTAERERALDYFSDHGVIDRVDIEAMGDPNADTLLMRRLHLLVSADVYLAPFPIADVLPTIDALWSGVPVIGLKSRSIDGSAVADCLFAAGLDDMVAETPAEYVIRAVEAAEKAGSRGFRPSFYEKTRKSSLFDIEKTIGGHFNEWEQIVFEGMDD